LIIIDWDNIAKEMSVWLMLIQRQLKLYWEVLNKCSLTDLFSVLQNFTKFVPFPSSADVNHSSDDSRCGFQSSFRLHSFPAPLPQSPRAKHTHKGFLESINARLSFYLYGELWSIWIMFPFKHFPSLSICLLCMSV